MTSSRDEQLRRARISLEGLSVGDAFGERFFRQHNQLLIESRTLPEPLWYYTDDSNMAFSIYQILSRYGEIRQHELALSFAEHYSMLRGYGRLCMDYWHALVKGRPGRPNLQVYLMVEVPTETGQPCELHCSARILPII